MNRMQMELKDLASSGKMLGLCIAVGAGAAISLISSLATSGVGAGIVINVLSIIVAVSLALIYSKAKTGNEIDSQSIKIVKIVYNIRYIFLIIVTVIIVAMLGICAGASSTIAKEITDNKEKIYEWMDDHDEYFEQAASSSSMTKEEMIDNIKKTIEDKDSLQSIISIISITCLGIFLITFIIMIIYYAKMTRLLKGIYLNSLGGSQIDTYASGYVCFCLIVSAVFTAFSVIGSIATPLGLLSSLASTAALILTYLVIKEYKDISFRMAYAQPQAYMPQGYGQGVNQSYNPNNFNGPQYNNPNDYNGPQYNNPNDDQNNNQDNVNQ